MFSAKSLLVLSTVAFAATLASAQTFVYTFEPHSAGGVDGHVKVQYASPTSTKADVSAHLDFSHVDVAAIQKLDGNCTGGAPTTYKWHIHVKWSSPKSSDSFAMCSKALTSNHYDPLLACGPNSEFAETPQCIPKIPAYACSPANYPMNPRVCEKGDLSGKFGDFKLDANKQVHGKWTDVNYPLVGENTPQWNIILHAVCGKSTPRVACALGKRTNSYNYGYSKAVKASGEGEGVAADADDDDEYDVTVGDNESDDDEVPVKTHKTHVRISVHGA